MRASEPCKQLIRDFEGCELKAYKCPADVLTIGYGHTGADVTEGMTITKEQAELLLDEDLGKVSKQVESVLEVDVNQNQFDAICSFVFNLGIGNFKKSTLLKKLAKSDFDGAAKEFLKWDKAGGKRLNGLTLRRQAEQRLFKAPIPED